MSDVDSERIDEMVTDVSVWIGRNAVGAMEDLYERDALIELQRLGKLAKDLLVKLAAVSDTSEQWQVRCAGCLCAAEGATGEQFAAKQGDYGWTPAYQKTLELRREFDQLRAELAAIREANAKLKLTRTDAVNSATRWASESEELAGKLAEKNAEIEQLKAERDEAFAKLANETKLYLGASEAQTHREIAACERVGITFGGCDTVHDLADVIEGLRDERDEAIGLLKWLKQFTQTESLLRFYSGHDEAKRILELTAKREGK